MINSTKCSRFERVKIIINKITGNDKITLYYFTFPLRHSQGESDLQKDEFDLQKGEYNLQTVDAKPVSIDSKFLIIKGRTVSVRLGR